MTNRRRFLREGAALGGSGLLLPIAAAQANNLPSNTKHPVACQHRLYVPGPFGQIHLTITEPAAGRASAPPIVCLPMSPRSGRDFDEFALALADRRQVIAPDVPGFGGSDPPPAPPRIEDYAAALLDGLGALLGRRAVMQRMDLVGQHTGVAIAVAAARQAPKRVRRIATIGVPMFSPEEGAKLRSQFARPRPYFDDPRFLCAAWERDAAAIAKGQSPERMLLRFTEIMRAGTRSHWGFNAVFNYDMRAALEQLPTPLLAIILNENLGAASRTAATLVEHGEVADLTDLPGSALDFASQRLADTCRAFFDRV